MNKKYYHELTDEEYQREIFDTDMTFGQLVKTYKQPDWCSYPDALMGDMGCLMLFYNRSSVSHENCANCECYNTTLHVSNVVVKQ